MKLMKAVLLHSVILMSIPLTAMAADQPGMVNGSALPDVKVETDLSPLITQSEPGRYFEEQKQEPVLAPDNVPVREVKTPVADVSAPEPQPAAIKKPAPAGYDLPAEVATPPAVTKGADQVPAPAAVMELAVKPAPVPEQQPEKVPATDPVSAAKEVDVRTPAAKVADAPKPPVAENVPAAPPVKELPEVRTLKETVPAKAADIPAAAAKSHPESARSLPTAAEASPAKPLPSLPVPVQEVNPAPVKVQEKTPAMPGKESAAAVKQSEEPQLASSGALSVERQRIAGAMLLYFKKECAPFVSAKKESGMFGFFTGDESPVLAKCLDDFNEYVKTFWGSPEIPEALQLLAQLHKSRKDAPAETAALSRLLYVYKDSPWSAAASVRLMGLAQEELKADRPVVKLLAKGCENPDQTERHVQFIKDYARFEGPAFLKLLRQESDEFLLRFPGHPAAESLLALREESFAREKRFELAASGYRRLLALYPGSLQRAPRLLSLGGIYDEQLKQYEQAVTVLEELYTSFPDRPESLTAYQRAARIFDEKLEKPARAVELLDRIVSLYPGDEPALRALEYQAEIYSKKMRNYYAAIKSYQRLADMFKGDSAVAALVKGAELARGFIEDYELQVELQGRLVSTYPDREEAIEALFNSAATEEEKLNNVKHAITSYQMLVDKYPGSKLAEKARARIEKLTAKK